jgi:uncharacterized protein with HEPN domain
VLRFVDGLDFDSYVEDRLLALERDLEILGKAARNVAGTTKAAAPEIPWGEINGLRNILAHAYSSMDHELIWNETIPKLPALIQKLSELIPETEGRTKP